MLKENIQRLLAKNLYANKIAYDWLFNKRTSIIQNLVDDFKDDDYLTSVEKLKVFKEKIDKDSLIFFTRNITWNNLHIYGIWEGLFSNYISNSNEYFKSPAIEHGLIFHNEVYRDVRYTARMSCATFSNFRKEIIQSKFKIPVFCVGPYINYSSFFYDQNYINLKKKNFGKTLLVFPTHSTDSAEIDVNQNLFCSNLKKIATNFDTVLINTFWWNINDPLTYKLKSEGYKIISCGFRDDVSFLPRLKSYFKISDLVMGDSIGTHVGYALSCNIPFCYVPSGTKVELKLVDEIKDLDFVKKQQNKIASAFLWSDSITEKQKELCNYYWGNNLIKSKEEIKEIVEINNDLIKMTYGFTGLTYYMAKKLLKKYYHEDDFVKYKLLKDAL